MRYSQTFGQTKKYNEIVLLLLILLDKVRKEKDKLRDSNSYLCVPWRRPLSPIAEDLNCWKSNPKSHSAAGWITIQGCLLFKWGHWLKYSSIPSSNGSGIYIIRTKRALKAQVSYMQQWPKCPWSLLISHF